MKKRETTNKIITNKMLTTEEFSSDASKDEAYLTNDISEVDRQGKHCA